MKEQVGDLTVSIAVLTIELLINPFLTRLSTNSLFVRPEQPHAMFLEPVKAERKKVRRECNLKLFEWCLVILFVL
jgi:hypothetical protein